MSTDCTGRPVEFGQTADDYDRFRPGFPESFRLRLIEHGWTAPGMRALDLGTGTGTVALALAESGLDVVGIDRSEELLSRARRRAAEAGLSLRFEQAAAEETGQPDGAFDLVSAGQCWWWFDANRALDEVRRVLVPGGRLLLASFCYLPLPGSLAAHTESLVLAHNPTWDMAGMTGIFESFVRDLDRGGFEDVESVSWVEHVAFTHESWRGRMRTCNGVGATLDRAEVARFDAELAALLIADHPEPLDVPHRIFVATGRHS